MSRDADSSVTVRSMTVDHSADSQSTVTYREGKTQVYSYDADGNIVSIIKEGVLTQSYEYDALEELARENDAEAGQTVTYGPEAPC